MKACNDGMTDLNQRKSFCLCHHFAMIAVFAIVNTDGNTTDVQKKNSAKKN